MLNSTFIETTLEYRCIKREEDIDYFIETDNYPIHLELDLPYLSRIQFPKSRAILVRTTPNSRWVTIHVLRNVDLYSSFANFEVELGKGPLHIEYKGGCIEVRR
ncbi:hypothetical protein CS063_12475 [Sporanaerobium hydrogeniformans]|uniref:Uncharacterized protein n=1 Tax=Sporanaerobium hydrogeniformans TaxID=3072179 RepID=A0AC61DC08_9FIRM|nr:hypothetical protein [Sporanaerobium hydrogeniformans]PHV70112.1 hypothetical protein CS063_12475 [Sporanaerobium hydrogeniformans]